MNRLISASGPWGSGSFVYDALGNLRSKTLGNRTVSLSYNSVNQLSQSNDSGHSGLRNFSYDSRGNVISAGNLQFNYDETDQPISISGSANGTYSYDAQLKRVKQQVNGNTIYSVYNQAGQLVHIDNLGTQQQTDYLSGPQGSFARISNGVISYLHPDILGSAQSATDANGNLLWQQQYTPFGEELQPVSANHHQAGFTGHISDTDTGLHYIQARYYDPIIGRFYSNDPIDVLGHLRTPNGIQGFNRYAYANNNPYKFTDPTGMSFEIEFDIPNLGDLVARMFDLRDAEQGTQIGNDIISLTTDTIQGAANELTSRVSVSGSGQAGIGLGINAEVRVDSETLQGEGVEVSAALTGTAFGAKASGTVNFTLVKPDSAAKGPITSTTIIGGAGLGGGVTVQWTPSLGVTLHGGAVVGASISSGAGGIKTRILD